MATVLALFDFDGTLYQGRVWRTLVDYFRQRGERRGFLGRFSLTHWLQWYLTKLRLYDRERFVMDWMKDLAGIFSGLSQEQVSQIFAWILENDIAPNLNPRIVERIAQHRAQGHTTLLISGSYQQLLDPFASTYGFDAALGTPLEFRDGRATGRIAMPVCMGPEKGRRLETWVRERGLEVDFEGSYAYVDSLFDVDLAERVGHPIVVAPEDQKMRTLALARGWPLID